MLTAKDTTLKVTGLDGADDYLVPVDLVELARVRALDGAHLWKGDTLLTADLNSI